MVSNLGEINWKEFEVAVPAFFAVIMMPLTYSIATGIAVYFIFYPITMLCKEAWKRSSSNYVCSLYHLHTLFCVLSRIV